jgi:hypothetical protein
MLCRNCDYISLEVKSLQERNAQLQMLIEHYKRLVSMLHSRKGRKDAPPVLARHQNTAPCDVGRPVLGQPTTRR